MEAEQKLSSFICEKEQLHEYQFKELKNTQKEILETQEEHNKRLQALEENKIEMRMEFQNLKQNQTEHKALMLDLDRATRERSDRLFDRVLTSQDVILNKVLENQNSNNKSNVEISKKRLALYGSIVTAIITLISLVINKLVK